MITTMQAPYREPEDRTLKWVILFILLSLLAHVFIITAIFLITHFLPEPKFAPPPKEDKVTLSLLPAPAPPPVPQAVKRGTRVARTAPRAFMGRRSIPVRLARIIHEHPPKSHDPLAAKGVRRFSTLQRTYSTFPGLRYGVRPSRCGLVLLRHDARE